MQIHQLQLRYDPLADRLLMQVRTRAHEVVAAWLTRRIALQLRAPLRDVVTQLSLPRTHPQAMAMPETKAMLEQVARERPLPGADFQQPFETRDASYPLGPEPLLAAHVDMRVNAQRMLLLTLREERGRHLELQLGDDLATALLRLAERALEVAEWQLPAAEPGRSDPLAPPAPPPQPRTLN
jgi:hypothetical protein